MARKPKYNRWEGLRREWFLLAMERTDFLSEPHPLSVQPFKTALANAYLQGIADAAEVMKDARDKDC